MESCEIRSITCLPGMRRHTAAEQLLIREGVCGDGTFEMEKRRHGGSRPRAYSRPLSFPAHMRGSAKPPVDVCGATVPSALSLASSVVYSNKRHARALDRK